MTDEQSTTPSTVTTPDAATPPPIGYRSLSPDEWAPLLERWQAVIDAAEEGESPLAEAYAIASEIGSAAAVLDVPINLLRIGLRHYASTDGASVATIRAFIDLAEWPDEVHWLARDVLLPRLVALTLGFEDPLFADVEEYLEADRSPALVAALVGLLLVVLQLLAGFFEASLLETYKLLVALSEPESGEVTEASLKRALVHLSAVTALYDFDLAESEELLLSYANGPFYQPLVALIVRCCAGIGFPLEPEAYGCAARDIATAALIGDDGTLATHGRVCVLLSGLSMLSNAWENGPGAEGESFTAWVRELAHLED